MNFSLIWKFKFKTFINCNLVTENELSLTADVTGQTMSDFYVLYVKLRLFNVALIRHKKFVNQSFLHKVISSLKYIYSYIKTFARTSSLHYHFDLVYPNDIWWRRFRNQLEAHGPTSSTLLSNLNLLFLSQGLQTWSIETLYNSNSRNSRNLTLDSPIIFEYIENFHPSILTKIYQKSSSWSYLF